MKRIIVVTDFSVSENGAGVSQTLYNLLASYEESCILNLVNREAMEKVSPSGVFLKNSIPYKSVFIPYFRNRIGLFINRHTIRINSLLALFLKRRLKTVFREFCPEIILICPNGPLGVETGLLLIKNLQLPSVIYFMDDWMASLNKKKTDKKINILLGFSTKQIFISEALRRIFLKRYTGLQDKYLVAHNPAKYQRSESEEIIQYEIPVNKFRIIYAGSIWPMHFDSLYKFALASDLVNQLKPENRIELLIYTREEFWVNYEVQLRKLKGVVYKGYVAYKDLQPKLREGNALLVTSSFLKEWRGHSEGSVQTKLTDYMVALRPIISIGPEWGACNQFVKTHGCGYVISDEDVSIIVHHISKIVCMDFTDSIRNSLHAIHELFDINKAQAKFYKFINEQ